MTALEPRDGGIAEDREGDLWRATAGGRWFSRDGDCQRLVSWSQLLEDYGPVDVYVWRAKAGAPDDPGA